MAHFKKREWVTEDGKKQVRWDAQVYVGRHPATGKPQFLGKTFKRKGEAEKWVRKEEVKKDDGEALSTSRKTLAEWLGEWLELHSEQVRDVTIYNYRMMVNHWILKPAKGAPPIGSIQLTKLNVAAFDRLYRHMSEQGVRPRTVQALHQVLRSALKAAVKKGYLSRNPTESATVPKPNAKGEEQEEDADAAEVHALSQEQAGRFLSAAKEDDRYSALWHVLLTGGLRPCEAFALKWQRVDFEAGEVHVDMSLTRIGLDKEQHPLGWKLTATKTKKSRRPVPLPDITMRELRRWQKLQAWEKRTFRGEYQDHGFVFTTEVGSPLDLSNLYRGPWSRVMERAGLGEYGPEPKKPRSGPTPKRPFKPSRRVYDLRHTHATLLLMDGEDLLVVSRRLGHSTIKLTADTYASVTKERSEGVASRFDRMFAWP
jgi:integrase